MSLFRVRYKIMATIKVISITIDNELIILNQCSDAISNGVVVGQINIPATRPLHLTFFPNHIVSKHHALPPRPLTEPPGRCHRPYVRQLYTWTQRSRRHFSGAALTWAPRRTPRCVNPTLTAGTGLECSTMMLTWL